MEHISAILANCWWMILLSALIAYLLGSINTAVLVTGIVTKGKKDIRQMGSGNAGFTNVLRSVGKVPAIITIVCDALKCIIAVLIGGFIFSFASVAFQGESPIFINELINCGKYVAGIFCILGHSYPVYFHFKGGKGVVTAAALMLTEDWRVFIAIIVTFLSLIVLSAGIPILQDKVVIGDIMPLVPGIALTTSIRDFFNGDYLSGAIHMIDAILTAFSIAVGVGAVITLYQLVTGGALLR